ncbi:hypothetical protein DET49_1208 [Salegentibacter sp. 24]|uniref:AAA family ATPase n=1 Tax=Salegentibacter sp. 24 TaxID=2183986 RepID=UPI0010603A68|nr:ATP-binding protein [Salegentibacter sp. 24]TDN83809.1 hypothetical protein DET49_1208 [Salegentibacter sp. 24]
MVILVIGLPGSGKSYFGSRLAKKLNAEYLNSDRLRKEMFSKRTYSDSERQKVYSALLNKVQELQSKGKGVVVDATFYSNKIKQAFFQSTKERLAIIEIWADENVIKERLKKARPFSEADFNIYQIIKQQWEPLEQPHLKLKSTNMNIDDMLQKALNYLKNDKATN